MPIPYQGQGQVGTDQLALVVLKKNGFGVGDVPHSMLLIQCAYLGLQLLEALEHDPLLRRGDDLHGLDNDVMVSIKIRS